MRTLHITDPMTVPEPSGPYSRFVARLIHDHREFDRDAEFAAFNLEKY